MPPEDQNKPVGGTPDAKPPQTPPDVPAESGDDAPDWVKDPARAYAEIKKAREEAKASRTVAAELEKRLKAIEDGKRDDETKKLEADKKYEELAKRLADENAKIKADLEAERIGRLRVSVAAEVGIPAAMADRLVGKTAEELKADAENLKKLLAPTQPDKPPRTPSTTTPAPSGRNPGETDEQRRARLSGRGGGSLFDIKKG